MNLIEMLLSLTGLGVGEQESQLMRWGVSPTLRRHILRCFDCGKLVGVDGKPIRFPRKRKADHKFDFGGSLVRSWQDH